LLTVLVVIRHHAERGLAVAARRRIDSSFPMFPHAPGAFFHGTPGAACSLGSGFVSLRRDKSGFVSLRRDKSGFALLRRDLREGRGMSLETAKVVAFMLVGLVGLVMAANQMLLFWQRITDRFKVSPPPAETYRTRKDCIDIHTKDRDWIRRVEGESRQTDKELAAETRKELRDETTKVHKRIDTLHTSMNEQFQGVVGELGRISGQLEGRSGDNGDKG